MLERSSGDGLVVDTDLGRAHFDAQLQVPGRRVGADPTDAELYQYLSALSAGVAQEVP